MALDTWGSGSLDSQGFLMQNLRALANKQGTSLEELAGGGSGVAHSGVYDALGLAIGADPSPSGWFADAGISARKLRLSQGQYSGRSASAKIRSGVEYWKNRKHTKDEQMLLGSVALDQLSDEDRNRLIADSDINPGKFLSPYKSKKEMHEYGHKKGDAGFEREKSLRAAAAAYIRRMQTKRRSVGAGTLERKTAADRSLEQRVQRRREYIR